MFGEIKYKKNIEEVNPELFEKIARDMYFTTNICILRQIYVLCDIMIVKELKE